MNVVILENFDRKAAGEIGPSAERLIALSTILWQALEREVIDPTITRFVSDDVLEIARKLLSLIGDRPQTMIAN